MNPSATKYRCFYNVLFKKPIHPCKKCWCGFLAGGVDQTHGGTGRGDLPTRFFGGHFLPMPIVVVVSFIFTRILKENDAI